MIRQQIIHVCTRGLSVVRKDVVLRRTDLRASRGASMCFMRRSPRWRVMAWAAELSLRQTALYVRLRSRWSSRTPRVSQAPEPEL